jgi:hypothetical protein
MSAEHPRPELPGLPNHDLGDVDGADGKQPRPRRAWPTPHHHMTKGGTTMLQPSRGERPPVEIHYLHQSEPARVPASVLALETLGRMHPATAITLVLAIAGMTAGTVAAIVGTVAIAALGLAVAAIMLGGRPPATPTR